MGDLLNAADAFDECCKLIAQNNSNKSLYAVILIDSLIDIYSHKYAEWELYWLEHSIAIREACKSDVSELHDKRKKLADAAKNFDSRFNWLADKDLISREKANSVKLLHEYRNQYLHRLKLNEYDCVAFSKLYLYLFEELFIAIPIWRVSLNDFDAPILKKIKHEKSHDCFSADYRRMLVNSINKSYSIDFSSAEFLNILKDFLLDKYNQILYLLHFIVESCEDMHRAAEIIEKDCNAGAVEIKYFGDDDDPQFSCTTAKTQNYLGKIRGLVNSSDENEGLRKFSELYKSLDAFAYPIHEKATEIDIIIQHQIDSIRGK